jgi:hypothetical protein
MQSPPPPSQVQADEAQRSRHAAEVAILALFASVETGGGSGDGDDESSVVQGIKIAAILSLLSSAIVAASFRHPRDRTAGLLLVRPDHDQIAERSLPEAQRVFDDLIGSELSDEQKAVLWATWAYSKTAREIADAINSGEIPHLFTEKGLVLKKVWISRSDGRVRPLHAKLHGKTVPSSDDFWRWPHTGQRLRWPGDREAPPEATIGCRCVCLLSWASQDEVSTTIKRIIEHTNPE